MSNDDLPPSTYAHAFVADVKAFFAFVMRQRHQRHRVVLLGTLFVLLLLHWPEIAQVFALQDETAPVATEEQARFVTCLLQQQLEMDAVEQFRSAPKTCKNAHPGTQQDDAYLMQLHTLLAGYPMDAMAQALAQQDPQVASFIIGIGKIESNWGKRSPWKGGKDCYNYWGYKSSGTRGQALGHACFGSPEEAVQTVAKRLHHFVIDQGRTTPQKLLVWKCGRSCASHDPAGVARWVGVVATYSAKVQTFARQSTQS